ncbi:MAG: DNA-binding protein [Thalassolituus sp.]|nr:MAG: DNA-binding protein [Thalassolituus sp.]
MNQQITIKLRDLVGDSVAIGNEEGREVFQALSRIVDQNPDQDVFEISLSGITATDASFPRESVVNLAKALRGEKAFFLSGFKNKDLIDNWSYGAIAKEQPLMILADDKRIWIGPAIKSGTKDLLDYIYSQNTVTTAMVADHLNVSPQNASGKLKKLYNQGFILGKKEVAESGGLEFLFRAIK